MFFLTYILSELRRRSGRTILTALGLGIGVGLVVPVNALSAGLDQAQAKILEPLTGVGTDMSVTRPIDFSPSNDGGFPQLSEKERQQLEQENGRGRFGLRNRRLDRLFIGDVGMEGDALHFGRNLLGIFLVLVDHADFGALGGHGARGGGAEP